MTDATRLENDLKIQLLQATATLGAFAVLLMLMHESGHYLAAKVFGWQTHFAYSRVTFQTTEPLTPLTHGLFKAAGPLVDAICVLFGLVYLKRTRITGNSRTTTIGYWTATGLVVFAVRWLKNPLQSSCDEAVISELLGFPWYVIPCIMLLPAFYAITYLVRTHWQERTVFPFAIGFAVMVFTFFVWTKLIGPRVLPRQTSNSIRAVAVLGDVKFVLRSATDSQRVVVQRHEKVGSDLFQID